MRRTPPPHGRGGSKGLDEKEQDIFEIDGYYLSNKLLGNKMTWLTDILALVEKIPASFWGVVFGSFLSLVGVVVSNRANDRRLRQQLAHDRELKNREREHSLRKDIYLATAEAIATGINSIGSFANLDISIR